MSHVICTTGRDCVAETSSSKSLLNIMTARLKFKFPGLVVAFSDSTNFKCFGCGDWLDFPFGSVVNLQDPNALSGCAVGIWPNC
jgi:hypothetical protein